MLSADTEALISPRYTTIVADPPWPYPHGFLRNRGGRYADGTSKVETVELEYPTLTLGDIKRLPVADLADRAAWLWLWTTDRWLPHAFAVVEAWGFEYCQTFIWHKSDGHPRFPTTFAPIRSEYLLACRRGTPRPKRKGIWPTNVIDVPFNPARMKHSQKPEAFLDIIETLCDGPYLELFARRNRFGWDTWGNEALKHIMET